MVRFVGEDAEVGKAGNGLKTKVSDFSACFVFLVRVEQVAEVALADGLFLDADFFGVGDDNVERAAFDNGDVALAVAGKNEFYRGRELLEQPERQDAVIGDGREFAKRTENCGARREDESVLHERPVGVFKRHRKLCGDNRSDERRFACAHRQSEDIAGVLQRHRLA